jgi:hypothetical protein
VFSVYRDAGVRPDGADRACGFSSHFGHFFEMQATRKQHEPKSGSWISH